MTTKTMFRLRFGRVVGVALTGCALLIAGCDTDKILKVTDTQTVNPATLDDPELMDIVWAGALGQFTNAWDSGDAFLVVSALMSDELTSAGTYSTRTATDRREQFTPADGNTSDAAYVNFHQARYALHDAAIRIAGWESTSHPYYQEMKALEGFTYVGLAEGYCSPLPFSEVSENGEFVYGEPMTLDAVFTAAAAIFDEAGGTSLAKVGKGRALLDAGEYAAAAAAVSGVPTTFVYWIYHSVSGVNNALYSLQGNGRYSVGDTEGGVGLPFRTAMDPRVPWYRDPGQPDGFDPAYPLYKSKRHYAYDAPVPLATGVEARLIEAEAKLQSGDGPGMITILNDLRSQVGSLMLGMFPGYSEADPSLDPLTDPGTTNARRDLLFQERAFWLFGTGHRLGDMRRLVRNYGMAQASVYPSGAYFKGGSYGSDVVFPLDFDEANNPNYRHDMCDVGSAG